MSLDLHRSIVVEIDGTGAVVGARKVKDALTDIDRATKGVDGGLRKVGDASRTTSASMASLGTAAKAAMAYFSVSTMAGFAKAVLDAGIAMDSLQRSLVAISGTRGGAASDMQYLREEADRLGQSFFTLAPMFKQVAAASRGTAIEGQATRDIFSAITEASTALGMSGADTEGALRAIAQMMSKGTVQAEELRGQLGERLPGAFQIMARALGKTTPELNKMLEQGQVLADEALPALAREITRMYGAAAETTALESGQAAINKLSEAWTDFKTNLYDSDQAVEGINAITRAIKSLTEYAGLRSISETFADGAKMAQEGKLNWEEFKRASYLDRQRMVDNGGTLNTFRGAVNRNDVRNVLPTVTASSTASGLSKAETSAAEKAAKAAKKAYDKMIADGKDAAEALDQYWQDYEDARVASVADGLEARREAEADALQLRTEFADKFRETVVGETEFQIEQLREQGEAYKAAGADRVAVETWVAQETLKLSRDWSSGAIRGLRDYADTASDAASQVESAITSGFKGMEDALVEFVKTGKLEFSDFADSVISDLARIAIQQSITGPLASAAGGFLSNLFSPSVASVGAPKVGYAKGGVPGAPSLSAYANTIVDSPTIFPFARGVGLMGEAGPEAIMPLKRGADGTLGVQGGGSNVVVNVVESPGNGGQQNRRNEGGTTIIDVMVEQIEAKIAGNMMRRQGPVYNANKSVFGLSGQPGAY